MKTYVVGTHWKRLRASNEYPQHMFSWRNNKDISTFGFDLFKAILFYFIYFFFFTFIDHRSRMT